MYAHADVCSCTHIHTLAYTCTHVCTRIHLDSSRACSHVQKQVNTRIKMYVYPRVNRYTRAHSHIHTRTQTCTHTHVHAHTYMHTCTQTRAHRCTHMYADALEHTRATHSDQVWGAVRAAICDAPRFPAVRSGRAPRSP